MTKETMLYNFEKHLHYIGEDDLLDKIKIGDDYSVINFFNEYSRLLDYTGASRNGHLIIVSEEEIEEIATAFKMEIHRGKHSDCFYIAEYPKGGAGFQYCISTKKVKTPNKEKTPISKN